jgi:hypothetical protein
MPFPFQIHNQLFLIHTQFLWLATILKTRMFICNHVADDLEITSHIWGKFKRVTQNSLKLCSSFYYNEKHWWHFQLAPTIAAIFLFSRILLRQHCMCGFSRKCSTFGFLTSLGHLRLNLKGMIENKQNRMSNHKPTSNDIYKPLETRSEHQH